jgi:copper(I)-binding protein
MVRRALMGLGIAVFVLAGCSSEKPAATAQASDEATAATSSGPDAKPGLAASGGRLVLPAVPGNPGAAYFAVANGDAKDAILAAVFIDKAERAEMHETSGTSMSAIKTVPVPAGQSVAFAPGGKHVMVFGIPDTVKAGSTVEMTLTFADGDKLSAPLTVEAAGGMADMEGMDHGAQH